MFAEYHDAQGYARQWLDNAARCGVPADVAAGIASHVPPAGFGLLEAMDEIRDPQGKSFFLVPQSTGGDDARDAVLLTYILNAGTGYGAPGGQPADFPETPYSAAEVWRIRHRQSRNGWSYTRDVGFVHRNGGRLVTTPNGMLMGLGGNWIQRQFSRRGGTTWGDIFMVNAGRITDPAERLRRVIRSPRSNPDLDRVLHHEEIHSQQWAAKGYQGMILDYGRELLRELVFGSTNRLEVDAGLSDGGYRS
ncbi:hypothetical protein ACOJVU_06055 [Mycobacterium sp. THU-M104]|uniref:hypothetical protein n=1 Tax=Mycobacterium sp. THU-M104 TaxID=3410515 RepID=UPI003B9B7A0E